MNSVRVLGKAVEAIQKHKAIDVLVLEVRGLVDYADYVVICSGQSDRQVQAIADHVVEDLKKEGVLPLGVEGRSEGQWVLLDFNDVIVHVFDEPVRDFYDLEGMWREAPRVPVPSEPAAVAAAHS
jgi:ribosome-associated protein